MNSAFSVSHRFITTLGLWLLAALVCTAEPPTGRLKVKSPEGTTTPVVASSDYRLCPNDVVEVRVFKEDELETTQRVAKNGTITFPLIKSATIGGLTRQEAEQRLEGLLKEYLVSPQVTVRIVEYTKRRFTVLGQVNNPGTFDLPDDASIDLLEAIGMAGGYTRIANQAKVTLKRKTEGREVIHQLNAKKMTTDAASGRFEIQPGDTIMVGESLF